MTPKKRWPNEAEWARLDAIALADNIDAEALPILNSEPMTEVERVQRSARIIRNAKTIILRLQAVGPQRLEQEVLAAALQLKD